MGTLRQVAGSLLLATFSALLVIGGILLALAESYVPTIPTPTQTLALIPVIDTPTAQALVFTTETLSVPSATAIPPISCMPPVGWIPVSVQVGDTLASLSLRHQTTPEELTRANCLFSSDLSNGSILYIPPQPTKTVNSCGKPIGWISYTVQAGNTMYSIGHAYGTSVSQLQFGNCIPSYRYSIVVGQTLWVPNITMTRTPLATATKTLTPVSIIFPTLTYTPTSTLTTIITPTATATGTNTATSTATKPPHTATPTATATITAFQSQNIIP